MSGTLPAHAPEAHPDSAPEIELVIDARPRDLGGFEVRRLLPSSARRLVGPFAFFDHFGPADLPLGTGLDVRPHPHICLATVTYLFAGHIVHRDSLGYLQSIRPGDVNWMSAGRGIVHSERSSPEDRRAGVHLHGIQCWVALPLEAEETEPFFEHHPARTIPVVERPGVRIVVIAGTAFGARSPVRVASPTIYAHVQLAAGARLAVDDRDAERAIYVVAGPVACAGQPLPQGSLAVLRPGAPVELTASAAAEVMILGGAKLAGERHIWWNFVASSKERIERAKEEWREGRFGKVVGDEVEFIPLPES